MARKSFTIVDDFLTYDENNGFSKFEKRKKHKKRFDDELGHRKDRKKTLKDYIKEQQELNNN